MKNQMLKITSFFALLLIFSSCGKDREKIKAAISETQIANLIEDALQENMGGLTEQVSMMVEIAKDTVSAQCGVTKDTTVLFENETLIGSAEYTTDYTWTLTCEADVIPLKYDFVCHSEGDYNNNRMSSSDASDANWTLDGLGESETVFSMNGTYIRNGEQTFKTDGLYTESGMNLNLTNVKIDKVDAEITEGIGDVNVSGKTENGDSFDFDAELIFEGGGKATLHINGKTFNIEL